MTHELKRIFEAYQNLDQKNISTVMATVVYLKGSSYRKPGVRMLVASNGAMVGAVSGGCVEKEILVKSQSVFRTNKPLMMVYDGRYRLGCEGILYILIEPFAPSKELQTVFWKEIDLRNSFKISSNYLLDEGSTRQGMGSQFVFQSGNSYPLFKQNQLESFQNEDFERFESEFPACFRLWVFGAEHDAVCLCEQASQLGWEIIVVASRRSGKSKNEFKTATEFFLCEASEIQQFDIDERDAVVLMSHHFATDLEHLAALSQKTPYYLGLLGPRNRKEKLFDTLIEYYPDLELENFNQLRGPVGLDIGAETPEEITISILAEIIAVHRNFTAEPLHKKRERIHQVVSPVYKKT